ncbi:hypothetical protein THOD04_20005 [Vibrio owensii]|nr:hypothetical protein THZB04_20610 [Vibrio owensii]CAH1577147.1 hypothetical protein THOD04_20005 [Vibrio owensii]
MFRNKLYEYILVLFVSFFAYAVVIHLLDLLKYWESITRVLVEIRDIR